MELPEGDYILICSVISYSDLEQSISVKAGDTLTINFDISEDGVMIDTGVQVEARFSNKSANAIDRMKLNDGGDIDVVYRVKPLKH